MGFDADTLALVEFFRARLDEVEAVAKAASGGTVIGEPGNWIPAPTGDEWEVSVDVTCDDFGPEGVVELLVALRPGVPRPPEVMAGCWGAVISWKPDLSDRDAWVPEPQFRHIARHDPAHVLREVAAKRAVLARHVPVRSEGRTMCNTCLGSCTFWPCPDVRDLASVWSDHPDYRPRWSVSPC